MAESSKKELIVVCFVAIVMVARTDVLLARFSGVFLSATEEEEEEEEEEEGKRKRFTNDVR